MPAQDFVDVGECLGWHFIGPDGRLRQGHHPDRFSVARLRLLQAQMRQRLQAENTWSGILRAQQQFHAEHLRQKVRVEVGQTLRVNEVAARATLTGYGMPGLYAAARVIDAALHGGSSMVTRVRLSGVVREWRHFGDQDLGREMIAEERTCLWIYDCGHLLLPLAWRVLFGACRFLPAAASSPAKGDALAALMRRSESGETEGLHALGLAAGWPWLTAEPGRLIQEAVGWAADRCQVAPAKGDALAALAEANAWFEGELFAAGAPRTIGDIGPGAGLTTDERICQEEKGQREALDAGQLRPRPAYGWLASALGVVAAEADLSIGEEGVITNSGGAVIVAVDQEADSDMTAAVVAKDEEGFRKIVEAGRAYFVDNGTRAKLLGYGDGVLGVAVYHVRVESGDHTGQDGWIPREWLKRVAEESG